MSFHLYRINELYSNASGSIQFIELTVGPANGENLWAGVTITASRAGGTNSYTFPNHLPSTQTANTTVLIATQGFADLGVVAPDYIVPAGFLFVAGGTLNFGGADQLAYGALPADGRSSIDRSGAVAVATPKNFAGATGTLPPPGPLTITGTAGDDVLTGTAADEIIDGLAGNDTLRGGGGNDTLRGGTGDDVIHSGPGDDTIDGGEGWDYLYYSEAGAGVLIDLRIGKASGGAGNDTIAGIDLIFGSPFADTYFGHDGGVNFLGGDGNDTITGGAGRDHLEGNGGDDIIDGLGGVDRVAYYSASGPVFVDLTAGTASGGLGNDTLRNIEDVTGSVFGDTLKGSAGDNRLEGSDGDDTLVATAGDDALDGGDGLDTAVYPLARPAYTLRRDGSAYVIEKPDAAGSDRLTGVERLRFADLSLALDLDGHAGQTAKLLGAVFGRGALANAAYAGIGLALLDGGMPYEELAGLAVAVTGRSAPADIVALLWTNIFDAAPTAEQAAPFLALLQGGALSVGALTVLAADSSFNTEHIGLVGLADTGLAFTG